MYGRVTNDTVVWQIVFLFYMSPQSSSVPLVNFPLLAFLIYIYIQFFFLPLILPHLVPRAFACPCQCRPVPPTPLSTSFVTSHHTRPLSPYLSLLSTTTPFLPQNTCMSFHHPASPVVPSNHPTSPYLSAFLFYISPVPSQITCSLTCPPFFLLTYLSSIFICLCLSNYLHVFLSIHHSVPTSPVPTLHQSTHSTTSHTSHRDTRLYQTSLMCTLGAWELQNLVSLTAVLPWEDLFLELKFSLELCKVAPFVGTKNFQYLLRQKKKEG